MKNSTWCLKDVKLTNDENFSVEHVLLLDETLMKKVLETSINPLNYSIINDENNLSEALLYAFIYTFTCKDR